MVLKKVCYLEVHIQIGRWDLTAFRNNFLSMQIISTPYEGAPALRDKPDQKHVWEIMLNHLNFCTSWWKHISLDQYNSWQWASPWFSKFQDQKASRGSSRTQYAMMMVNDQRSNSPTLFNKGLKGNVTGEPINANQLQAWPFNISPSNRWKSIPQSSATSPKAGRVEDLSISAARLMYWATWTNELVSGNQMEIPSITVNIFAEVPQKFPCGFQVVSMGIE